MILVLNTGSSSLKFRLLNPRKKFETLYKGHVDGISLPSCTYKSEHGNNKKKERAHIQDHQSAITFGLEKLIRSGVISDLSEIKACGHRVVHGGETYRDATIINPDVIHTIKRLSALAPLHNPANLEGILAAQKLLPKIKHVAVFDTAFHSTIPEHAYLYALPYPLYKKDHIRRYGFHGTSHKYVSGQAIQLLGRKKSRIITCHLGNGCSLTAVKDGISIDTSMGFTPLEGVPMGTRSGDIDPAIVFHLIREKKFYPGQIETMLNRHSGLKGVSGISSDMRKIHEKSKQKDPKALRTLDLYVYRIVKYLGSYEAALGGLDAIVFTAGIGEGAWYVRRDVCAALSHLGLKLDAKKNRKHDLVISTPKSKIKVFVIPTNEGLQIAKETWKLVK